MMFDKISSFEMLLKSFYKARKGKRDRISVAEYEYFIESNILKLRQLLYLVNIILSPTPILQFLSPKQGEFLRLHLKIG